MGKTAGQVVDILIDKLNIGEVELNKIIGVVNNPSSVDDFKTYNRLMKRQFQISLFLYPKRNEWEMVVHGQSAVRIPPSFSVHTIREVIKWTKPIKSSRTRENLKIYLPALPTRQSQRTKTRPTTPAGREWGQIQRENQVKHPKGCFSHVQKIIHKMLTNRWIKYKIQICLFEQNSLIYGQPYNIIHNVRR